MLLATLNVLYFYISTSHRMCAEPNTAVFCGPLTSCFPRMLLRYCLSNFQMVLVAPIIPGITFTFTFHIHCYFYCKFLYF